MKKNLENIFLFSMEILKEMKSNDLIFFANNLTYKMIFSIFPLIIFLMTIIGYLELDISFLFNDSAFNIPKEFSDIINNFLIEVFYTKRPKLLQISLAISILSASSGFRSLIYGINRAYDQEETRNIFFIIFLSIILVFIFALIIISFSLLFVFNDIIIKILNNFTLISNTIDEIYRITTYLSILVIMIISIMFINKISLAKKVSVISLMPGSIFTVLIWIIASKLFNIYINNFSKFSNVYGSIGSIIILIIWLNIISIVFLLGTQINSLINKKNIKFKIFKIKK